MKSLLAVFLALVAVAQAANEIQSFTITSRDGNTLGFTVLVNQAAEPVILTFTVTDTAGPTEVNKQTETIDTTMVQGSRTFSFNGFIPGVRYAVRVEAALQSAPNSPTDAETITFTFFLKSFVKGSQTGGDLAFTVIVNPAQQDVDLVFTIRDLTPGADPEIVRTLNDLDVPISSADQQRPFNVTGLPGGKDYEAKIVAQSTADPNKVDSATILFSVAPYSSIVVRTPVVTPPTDGGSPTAKLAAKIDPSGGTIDKVFFDYGTSAGAYSEHPEASLDAETGDWTVTVPAGGAPELKRGTTYHYQVRVDVTNSTTDSTSPNSTFATPANRAPVAVTDSVRIRGEDSTLIDVLKNDRDPDGDEITLIRVSPGTQGTTQIEDGMVRYTPRTDADAGDTFTYTIRDDYTLGDNPATDPIEGSLTATGTVLINAPGLSSRGLHAAEIKDEDGNVVGLLRLNGTGGGSVSGKLQLFTKTYIVEGEIRENGHFYFTIPRGEDDDLQLDVNFASEENTFEASLKAGEDEWSGISEINTLTDKRRDEVVGRYTIEFPAPGGDDSTFPQGNGYARIDVKPWGDVGIKGKLGDGTKFSTKGVLTGTGEDARVSMWVTPKQSRVSALFNFGEGLNPNISGPMRWYRNPSDSDFFPDGFYVPSLTTSGSRFTEQENNRSLSDAKKATLTLTAGNLSGTITQAIEITKSDKVIFLNSNPFGMEMSIDRDTGLFKGNFDHPFDDSRRKFQGALLQSQSKGSGVFLGIDRSGAVSISPGLPQAPVPTPTPTPPTTPTTPTNPNTPNIPNIPNIPGLNGDSIR